MIICTPITINNMLNMVEGKCPIFPSFKNNISNHIPIAIPIVNIAKPILPKNVNGS